MNVLPHPRVLLLPLHLRPYWIQRLDFLRWLASCDAAGVESTMLRRDPRDSSAESVWLANEATVANGDLVQLVGKPPTSSVDPQTEPDSKNDGSDESGPEFVLIRTDRGDEGYIRSAYLRALESRLKRGAAATKVNYNEKVLIETRKDTWAEQVHKRRESNAPLFEVDEIVDKRVNNYPIGGRRKGLEYLVRWKGYSPADDTWEPVHSLTAVLGKVRAFEKKREEEEKQRAEDAKAQAKRERQKTRKQRGAGSESDSDSEGEVDSEGDSGNGSGSESGTDSDGAGERGAKVALRACTRCGKPGHNSRTCSLGLRPRPPSGPPPLDEAGTRQRGVVMRAVVGEERERLLAKRQEAKAAAAAAAMDNVSSPEGEEEGGSAAAEHSERAQQNPLLEIVWVPAGTVTQIQDPDLGQSDESSDIKLVGRLEVRLQNGFRVPF